MALNLKYPIIEHERAVQTVVDFYAASPVDATSSHKKTGFKD